MAWTLAVWLLGAVETGNESGIGFEDDLSSTNFFLGRIKFGGRWTCYSCEVEERPFLAHHSVASLEKAPVQHKMAPLMR